MTRTEFIRSHATLKVNTTAAFKTACRLLNNWQLVGLSKISPFASDEQINYCHKPKTRPNNWSERHLSDNRDQLLSSFDQRVFFSHLNHSLMTAYLMLWILAIKLELKCTHIGWFLLPRDKMISSQVHLLLRVWYSENLFPIFPWKRKYCYNLCHLNHAGKCKIRSRTGSSKPYEYSKSLHYVWYWKILSIWKSF